MKYFISLLFFSILFQANSQIRLEGNYCNSTSFESECIEFKTDGTFEYIKSECTSFSKGNGKYKFILGKLKLNFTKRIKQKKTSVINKKEFETKENEKGVISVKIYSLQDSSQIEFANIILIDTLLNNELIRGVASDSTGHAILEVKDANSLRIFGFLHERLEIPISNNKNTELVIYLAIGNFVKYLNSKNNISFRIKKKEDKQFLLKKRKEKRFKKYVVK